MNYSNLFKQSRISIVVTLIAAAVASCSLSLIPFTSGVEEGKSNIMAYMIAATFWIGLLLTFVATYITKRILGEYRKKLIADGRVASKQLIGLISFSKNWRMLVLYGITVLGGVLIITDIIFGYVPEAIMFPIISVTMLSFAVHCVVDGKYYKAYKQIKESVDNETNR